MESIVMSTETAVADLNAFSEWLTAGTTRSFVYHRGRHVTESEDGTWGETSTKARLAWKSAVERKVYLLQRRVDERGVFDYIAIRAAEKVPLRFAAV